MEGLPDVVRGRVFHEKIADDVPPCRQSSLELFPILGGKVVIRRAHQIQTAENGCLAFLKLLDVSLLGHSREEFKHGIGFPQSNVGVYILVISLYNWRSLTFSEYTHWWTVFLTR